MAETSVVVSTAPLRVVEWTTRTKRVITAVFVPQSASDAEPWALYEGDNFLGRFPSKNVPASARVQYEGVNAEVTVKDGTYYEVVVDGRPGVGVRNGPLSKGDASRPWIVRLHGDRHSRPMVDALPDDYVQVGRPVPNA